MRLQADLMVTDLILLVAEIGTLCANSAPCIGLNFVVAGMVWDEINAIKAEYHAMCG
jgi:hypothetical protein